MNETNEEGEGSFQRTPPLAPSSATYINYHSVSRRRSVRKIDEVPLQREQLLLGVGAMVVAVWISMNILKALCNSAF